MTNISIKLPRFSSEFSKNIKKEITSVFSAKIPPVISSIRTRLQKELKEKISQSQEWQEIVSGKLRGELGIPDTSGLDDILETWTSGIIVEFNKNKELGSIQIRMIRSDYSDVLSLPDSSFVYSSRNGSKVIEWLRWLLLEGPGIIVIGYDFVPSNKGRTGLGIMVRSRNGWKVPDQYAGTSTDNFVTRSLVDIYSTIETVVSQEVNRGL
jgi:hypothetical protein